MFRQYRLINRFIRYYRVYVPNRHKSNYIRKLMKFGEVQLLISAQTFCSSKMEDSPEKLEDDITKAIQEGEAATIKLMTQLKDFVVGTSEEYRNCIRKQISIMTQATFQEHGGNFEMYDKLPEYRTIANDLKKNLTEYCTLFHTLVNMSSGENTKEGCKCKQRQPMTEFQVLQKIVEEEIEMNSKCEKELLQAVTDNILHEIFFDTIY